MTSRKIILKNEQSPGDVLMLTAAVRDLKLSHPDIEIDVRTSCPALWENNPYLTHLSEEETNIEILKADYPLIHESNECQYHFIHGFRKDLEEKLNIKIKPTLFKGDIHLSDEEKSWMSQIEEMGIKDNFWIIFAGGKFDFTCKWWNPIYYQKVVDHFKGRITFVQCGEPHHWHPKLEGAIDLIGKTDLRMLIRLIYHSVGIVCPVTFAMHAAVAIPSKYNHIRNRPCVVIAGGREPSQWEKYPHHRFLETNGYLYCCDNGGCWASRCQRVGDGDEKDKENLCIYPTRVNETLFIPRCMEMIKPRDVIRAIEGYYKGGILKYNE